MAISTIFSERLSTMLKVEVVHGSSVIGLCHFPRQLTIKRCDTETHLMHFLCSLLLNGERELLSGAGLEPVRRFDVENCTDGQCQSDGHERCHKQTGPNRNCGESDAVPGAAELGATLQCRLDLKFENSRYHRVSYRQVEIKTQIS